jgi:hypothetical protein
MLNKFAYITILLSISCNIDKPQIDFNTVLSSFIKDYAQLFPDETPLSIDNTKLSEMHIPSDSLLQNVASFLEKYKKDVVTYEHISLESSATQDFKKMKGILSTVERYYLKSDDGTQIYDAKLGFERIMKSEYAGVDFRLQTLFNKLDYVPQYYEAAKKRLVKMNKALIDPTVKNQTETYLFFDKTLPQFVNENHQLTPQYLERLNNAKLAVQDYIAYIESFKLGIN